MSCCERLATQKAVTRMRQWGGQRMSESTNKASIPAKFPHFRRKWLFFFLEKDGGTRRKRNRTMERDAPTTRINVKRVCEDATA